MFTLPIPLAAALLTPLAWAQDVGEPQPEPAEIDELAGAEADPEPAEPAPTAKPRGDLQALRAKIDASVYADVGIVSSTAVNDFQPSFNVGMVDLFARSQIADNVQALTEVMAGEVDGMLMVHVPRIFIDYRATGWLNLRAGRYHSPLGGYTTSYPHGGGVYRLAVDRPRLLSMDHGEEMIPNHLEGLMATATRSGAGPAIRLDATVARDHHDASPGWGSGLRLTVFQGGMGGAVEAGVSAYVNRISAAVMDHGSMEMSHGTDDDDELDLSWEQIAVLHVAVHRYPIEGAAEAWYIRHSDALDLGDHTALVGAFAQAGYTWNRYTPYGRYEYFQRDAGDPVFGALGAPLVQNKLSAGLRTSVNEKVSIKGEYGFDLAAVEHAVTLQADFGF